MQESTAWSVGMLGFMAGEIAWQNFAMDERDHGSSGTVLPKTIRTGPSRPDFMSG